MVRIVLALFLVELISIDVCAQDSSEEENAFELEVGMYIDLFYGYDFNQPQGTSRLPYLYHHNRHNELNMNHGILSLGLGNNRIRANLSLQAGTYVDDNYTSETSVMKNVYDANVGLALDSRKRWWVDVGIFGSSWVGMESTLSYENFNLSHNLISENVPYYYTGINTSFKPNDNWYLSAIITNGWQKIQRVEGNSLPSFATQITYTSNSGNSLNWSSFMGTDDPDSTRRIRVFNHLNTHINLSDDFILAAGFDFGFQQKSKNSTDWDQWYGTAIILRYSINYSSALAFRYEYYHDPQQVIVTSLSNIAGYKTSGFTLNYDRRFFDIILLRFEGRYFTSPDSIYPEKDQGLVKNNFFLLGSIALNWTKVFD